MDGKKTFLHITYVFHPDMGYDINMMVKYYKDSYRQFIISSADTSLWNETPASISQKDRDFEAKWQVTIIRLPFFKRGKKNLTPVIKGIPAQIKQIKPDITFLHGIESHAYCLSIGSILRHSNVFACDTHTLYNQIKYAALPWKLYSRFYLKPFIIGRINKARHLAYYTAKDNRHFLVHYLGIDEKLIRDNEISTDERTFHHYIDEDLKRNLDIKPEELVLMYVGKFDEFKKPHLVLDAMSLIKDKLNRPIHLVFAGPRNKDYFDRHFKDLQQIGTNIRVTMLPPLDNNQLYKYYSLAYCMVIPEQNSLSSLDAQACKTPVIMKADATNSERLKEGGLPYEENNLQDLANKILQICEDQTLRNKLAENGYQYIMQHYNYPTKLERIKQELEGRVK